MSVEMLIDADLQEIVGGTTPPDLVERTLARIETAPGQTARAGATAPRGRTIPLWRLAAAACVLFTLGMIGWLLWPVELPAGVVASTDAGYVVRDDHIELKAGWLLLTDGAPEVRAHNSRVADVHGRLVAGTAIPDEAVLESLADQLNLSETERAMLKQPNRWLTAGSLSLCLFTGNAILNGEVVSAQDVQEERPERVEDPAPGTDFRVLREWTGADSKITERRVEIVTDLQAWRSLWSRHRRIADNERSVPKPAPEIDFENEMVVAAFAGSSTNSRGCFVHEILELGATFTVRVDESTYQTMNGADSVTPYGLFVVPLTDYAVVIEENVQSLLNKPPLWKEIGRREMGGLPDTEVNWNASFSRAEIGGPGVGEFRAIYTQDQWAAAIKDIGVMNASWPMPDFGKSIGFVAFGKRLQGLEDGLTLTSAGVSSTKAVLRLDSPVAQARGESPYENIFGVWLFPRPNRDVVLESAVHSMIDGTRWQESATFRQEDAPFGVHHIESGFTDGMDAAKFGLAHNQQEFHDLTEGMSVRWEPSGAEWVNWDKEDVIVVFPGEMRISGGLTTTTASDHDVHTITYHLSGPSGRDPGLKQPYMFIKIPKTDKQIVLKQSKVAGPAPAEITEVARFE